ncbi:MAG TPA: hypothetical protein VGV89_07185 [Thermoplasmata archaeon]|nr:hypothetical protein [Thermoplasmata archaeon]
MSDQEPTLDARLRRLEQLAEQLEQLARQHPIGRAILRKLGLL